MKKVWVSVLSILSLSCWGGVPSLVADERPAEITILQPGVLLTLVAEHPQLATPTGIDVDDQGRVWVVATHTHFRPEDYVGPENDEILIFCDSNSDGTFDQRQVFYNKTRATMDLELGPQGWVYLAQRDRILRIKDQHGTGQADVEETLVKLQTEADYPHNGLEGLTWNLAGDLIFGLGENFAKPWTITGADGVSLTGSGEGGIFQVRADGTSLKRIAHGFWNPFGICVREDGEIFAVDNDPGDLPPCRLLHIIEGGDYGYQRAYGSEAHHPFVGWNGELRGTLPMIHPAPEAPCGILPLGQGLLVPSWSDHRIDFMRLSAKGASYTAQPITLLRGGRYFRPTCLAADPGATGSIKRWYLADWVDGSYQSHGYGRLWKLEVHLEQADWIGEQKLEPRTRQRELLEQLQSSPLTLSQSALLEISRGDDPFLARSALRQLAQRVGDWSPTEFANRSVSDRVQGVLALRMANVPIQPWLSTLRAETDQTVLFEILRWIAETRSTFALADVEEILQRSGLEYIPFEAGIATWNVLSGQPENGIRNPELLLARLQDSASPPHLRAFALRLLPTLANSASSTGSFVTRNFPKGLTAIPFDEDISHSHLRCYGLETNRQQQGGCGDDEFTQG